MIVCKVNADQADSGRSHVRRERYGDVGGVSIVREFIVDDLNRADLSGYLEFDDRDFTLALFFGDVREECFCFAVFDVAESVAVVLVFVVDVEQVGWLEKSADVVDANRNESGGSFQKSTGFTQTAHNDSFICVFVLEVGEDHLRFSCASVSLLGVILTRGFLDGRQPKCRC